MKAKVVKEILGLVNACGATEPKLPEHARERLEKAVKPLGEGDKDALVLARETQHTPGPWHVIADPVWKGKHPLHDARYVATCDESGIEVYTHGPDDEKGWRFASDADSIICTMPDSPKQKEHARLIAAAPALVEALRELFDLIDNGTLVRDTSHDADPSFAIRQLPLVQALAKANAALAKVERGSE